MGISAEVNFRGIISIAYETVQYLLETLLLESLDLEILVI